MSSEKSNTIDYTKPTQRTDQEAFDIAARHLLKQGRRSTRHGDGAYRGDDGLKCAIGALIPDEVYQWEWDAPTEHEAGLGVTELLRLHPEVAPYLPSRDLARALQVVHDLGEPETWPERLRYVAKTFGLDAGVLG